MDTVQARSQKDKTIYCRLKASMWKTLAPNASLSLNRLPSASGISDTDLPMAGPEHRTTSWSCPFTVAVFALHLSLSA